ncbi:zinc finger BED domain-containing protein RICESLEEPER 2-like [Pistacia vera]|uniref:zinc finger BED domain-containing protein RICESLEEPER 2-like n=1 Tax=Pistacia vera TaxID=55513 RepID=UPI001262B36A|nr:zinc finger BED domain-containing protein RICESLEEPER 2-like [Pistacia vera]
MAIKLRRVFASLEERDISYQYCPKEEDWDKVEKVCEILKVFNDATNLISRSDYPTSNLFLKQVCSIKIMLDNKSEHEDEFIRIMVRKMKQKFDKYWGECNLLMVVLAVLNPRLKMRVIQWAFPKIYPEAEAPANIVSVRDALYEVYEEYVDASKALTTARASTSVGDRLQLLFAIPVFTIASELEIYLEEKCLPVKSKLNILDWWKVNATTYKVLSYMARDVFDIPVSTVASELAFSTSGRVLDHFRSSLSTPIVEALVCTQDWLRYAYTPITFEDYLMDAESYDSEINAHEASNLEHGA